MILWALKEIELLMDFLVWGFTVLRAISFCAGVSQVALCCAAFTKVSLSLRAHRTNVRHLVRCCVHGYLFAMSTEHEYKSLLVWEGNLGDGTSTYHGYSRRWRVKIDGKPDLVGSADPTFRGESEKFNPEDLLVAALSSCHMLSYLALCAQKNISVLGYRDKAWGVMKTTPNGGGRFEQVTLRPEVRVADKSKQALAKDLHEKAHSLCFIASSVSFDVHVIAVVTAEV
jgi:organic hydroperoxide reductase OsmC/OhrA